MQSALKSRKEQGQTFLLSISSIGSTEEPLGDEDCNGIMFSCDIFELTMSLQSSLVDASR
jgi:hypothetical protein